MESQKGLLSRSFLMIALGNLVSRMGTVVYDVVLAWWLIDATGSAVYMGWILAASQLPIAVLGPICGVLSDRWNKKWILILADVVGGLTAIGVSVMAHYNYVNLPLLMLASFIFGVSAAIFKPTVRSIVPMLVQKGTLIKANSITNNIAETTKVVGPVVGGLLMAVPGIGVAGSLFLNGLSFLLSAVAELFIAYRHKQKDKKAMGSVYDGLKQGFRYINGKPLIKRLIYLSGAVNFFLVSFNILIPLYVKNVIGGSGNLYSYVLAAEAVGGVVITLVFLFSKNIKPKPLSMGWLIALTGVSLGLMPLANYAGLLALTFLQGLFMGAFNTLLFTYIQEIVDQEYLGRVFSIVYMVAIVIMPVSYITFGYLGDHIINSAFLYAGIGTVLCCIPFLRMKKGEASVHAESM
jgi:MFS transporter, DHA3 family, macrolide efflux protein